MFIRLIAKFLKVFFALLYHGFAFLYDTVASIVSLGRWQDWVYSVIPDLDREPILELGHGPGHLQKKLLLSDHCVFGLDESRQMSRLARNRLEGLPYCLVRGDACRMPFPDASFPIITATFPSEYIIQTGVLQEIHRTLSSDGKVVILLAAWPGGDSLMEKIVRFLFQITGESPPETVNGSNFQKIFSENHFQAETAIRACGNSRLLVVFLKKDSHFLLN